MVVFHHLEKKERKKTEGQRELGRSLAAEWELPEPGRQLSERPVMMEVRSLKWFLGWDQHSVYPRLIDTFQMRLGQSTHPI
jgi:hypothetical protein